MKNKIVIWGEDSDVNDKVLLALELRERENKVMINVIPSQEATEEFYNKLLKDWKDNKEVVFPESSKTVERELSVTDSILPDNLKSDKTDILNRAQAEWHFNVLSAKLYEMYKSELDEYKDKIDSLSEFSEDLWNEMKSFWDKVQVQVRERNMFRDHASTLKERTNNLFEKLKALRKEMKKELEQKSSIITAKYLEEIKSIETKVQEGLALSPIFNELKQLQGKFFKEDLSRKDKDSLWKKIDKLFKDIKEKKFGDKGNSSNKSGSRLQSRFDGLMKAISRMQNSIAYDKKDIDFQNNKINTTDGQLEMQIRQAKLVMIQQRIDSKQVKLDDMLKTKVDLEKSIAKEKQKAIQQELQKEKEIIKIEVKKKIAEGIQSTKEDFKEVEDKLTKAAEDIKASKKKPLKKVVSEVVEAPQSKETDSIVEKVADKIEDVVESISESVVSVIDSITDKVQEIDKSISEEE